MQHDFLQLHVLIAARGFAAENQAVAGPEAHIAVGHFRLRSPQNHRNHQTGRKRRLPNQPPAPLILRLQHHLNEVDVRLQAVLAELLNALILLHKTGGNDTRRDGHHAHAQESDEDAEGFAQHSNGVDVAVADGEQGGGGPPDSGKGVPEDLRLGVMLHAVEAQAGGQHQHQYDKKRGQELLNVIKLR